MKSKFIGLAYGALLGFYIVSGPNLAMVDCRRLIHYI